MPRDHLARVVPHAAGGPAAGEGVRIEARRAHLRLEIVVLRRRFEDGLRPGWDLGERRIDEEERGGLVLPSRLDRAGDHLRHTGPNADSQDDRCRRDMLRSCQ